MQIAFSELVHMLASQEGSAACEIMQVHFQREVMKPSTRSGDATQALCFMMTANGVSAASGHSAALL